MTREGDALASTIARDVRDQRVLNAITEIPREAFVPADLRDRAYENSALPIGLGQTISQPLVVARMAELLDVGPDDLVLDVGTGSGYHAAVLARLAAHVWTVERHERLAAGAVAALDAAGIANVSCLVGDGAAGLPDVAPFDAINVAAAARADRLDALVEQLAPRGRLVAPVRLRLGGQHLRLARRPAGDGPVAWETHEPVRFVPLL